MSWATKLTSTSLLPIRGRSVPDAGRVEIGRDLFVLSICAFFLRLCSVVSSLSAVLTMSVTCGHSLVSRACIQRFLAPSCRQSSPVLRLSCHDGRQTLSFAATLTKSSRLRANGRNSLSTRYELSFYSSLQSTHQNSRGNIVPGHKVEHGIPWLRLQKQK